MLSRSVTDVPTAAIVRTADSGPAAQLKVVTLRGHTYVIPASAMAYLGRTLDPQLFDVTAMQRAGYGDRIPLAITFKPGTKPSLPGVTFTKIGASTARAYVTQDSARTFGAALADQAITDSLAGWPATDALFGSVTGIAPVFPAPGGVTPDFPQSTLIIDGISKTGGPMRFAFGVLFNAEDGRKFGGFVLMVNGQARASVPLGTYTALLDDFAFDADGSATVREIVVTDFAVTGQQGHMVIDSRDATTTTLAHDAETLDRPGSLDVGHDKRRCTPLHVRRGLGARERRDDPLHTDAAADGRNAPPRHPVDQDRPFDARWRVRVRRFILRSGHPGRPVPDAGRVRRLVHGRLDLRGDRTTRARWRGSVHLRAARELRERDVLPHAVPAAPRRVRVRAARFHRAGPALADAFGRDPGFMDGRLVRFVPGTTIQEHWFGQPFRLGVPPVDPTSRFAACFACVSPHRMAFLSNLSDSDPWHTAELFGARRPSPGSPSIATACSSCIATTASAPSSRSPTETRRTGSCRPSHAATKVRRCRPISRPTSPCTPGSRRRRRHRGSASAGSVLGAARPLGDPRSSCDRPRHPAGRRARLRPGGRPHHRRHALPDHEGVGVGSAHRHQLMDTADTHLGRPGATRLASRR